MSGYPLHWWHRGRILPTTMEWQTLAPGIIGSFVGVMGWLLVGLYIQRRQFHRQARNAAKAVYFEIEVNRTAIAVAREHAVFADLDRTSFERLLPELATLLSATDLRIVVDAYMTHAGYRQLAAQETVPPDVRRSALGVFADAHARALTTLRTSAFTRAEARAVGSVETGAPGAEGGDAMARAKP